MQKQRNNINNVISSIKDLYGVKIHFAIESGSRLWGISSKDSDYDIRFVYSYPKEKYLSFSNIDRVIDTESIFNGAVYDFVGFDIYKFSRLLMNSNPSTIEWINSNIIYVDDGTLDRLKKIIHNKHDPYKLFKHYKSMCKSNYLNYIDNNKRVTAKKYLYSLRGLINSLCVLKNSEVPPLDFEEALIVSSIDSDIKNIIFGLLYRKRVGKEDIQISRITRIDNYITDYISNKKDEIEQSDNIHSIRNDLEVLVFRLLDKHS